MQPRVPGRRRERRRTFTGIVVLAALAGMSAGAAQAAVDTEAAARGRVTYRVYCMNCHGPQAKGDGKLAPMIKIKIADLTRIAAKHGGTFPEETVYEIVDGRKEVAAHGLREMPVWGDAFQRPEEGGDQEAKAKAKVHDLVEFLKSIQAEPKK
jgi:mono/diheme cytochrome c family protein